MASGKEHDILFSRPPHGQLDITGNNSHLNSCQKWILLQNSLVSFRHSRYAHSLRCQYCFRSRISVCLWRNVFYFLMMGTWKLNCIFFFSCNEHIAMQATRPWWLLRLERNGWAHSDTFLGPPDGEKKKKTHKPLISSTNQHIHTHANTLLNQKERARLLIFKNFFHVILLYLE